MTALGRKFSFSRPNRRSVIANSTETSIADLRMFESTGKKRPETDGQYPCNESRFGLKIDLDQEKQEKQ